MEDQPADAGDLTAETSDLVADKDVETSAPQPGDTEGADIASPVAPLRRGGRHRWFRPRPPATPAASNADEPASAEPDAEDAAPEESAVDEKADAAEQTEDAVVTEEASVDAADAARLTEAAGAGGWRRLLRRRAPAQAGEPEPADTKAAGPEAADTEAADTEAADTAEAAGEASDGEAPTEAAGETPAAATKPVGKVLPAAIIAAAVVFVGAGAFAGAMIQPYLADKALVDTKLEVARTATSAITTLWTYTPDNMDKLPDRSAKFLAGDFQDQYRKYIDAIAPVNKQAKVSNSTQVVGAAVESLEGRDATAVVYTNTTNTSPQSNNIPSLRYLSYRLTMQRHGSQWQITKMTTVTSLDLTPKLG